MPKISKRTVPKMPAVLFFKAMRQAQAVRPAVAVSASGRSGDGRRRTMASLLSDLGALYRLRRGSGAR